jgi:aspartate aminotransferase
MNDVARRTLHANVQGFGQSPTLSINERSAQLIRDGRRVYRLGFGQSPFPIPERVVEALREHAHEKDYLPVCGLPALREAVAAHHARRHGLACSAEDVLIAPGSKELMFLLQVVCDAEVVLATPAWVSYEPQARVVGRSVRLIATRAEDGWRLLPRELDTLCQQNPERQRVLILNYPSNPTGTTYSAQELEALAEVARRHGVLVLSDEIYGELHFEGRHVSMARAYPEATIVSSGLSKWCGAGGWRLGTFVVPRELEWLRTAMAAVASETYSSTSAPIQYAAVLAFEGGPAIERGLVLSRAILAAIVRAAIPRLRDVGARVEPAVGGFYLFPDFGSHAHAFASRGIETSDAFCERLLEETGVAVLPGSAFGRARG